MLPTNMRFEDVGRQIGKRFDEFARMVAKGVADVDKRFELTDKRFEHIEKRLGLIDTNLKHIDARLDKLERDNQEIKRDLARQG